MANPLSRVRAADGSRGTRSLPGILPGVKRMARVIAAFGRGRAHMDGSDE